MGGGQVGVCAVSEVRAAAGAQAARKPNTPNVHSFQRALSQSEVMKRVSKWTWLDHVVHMSSQTVTAVATTYCEAPLAWFVL